MEERYVPKGHTSRLSGTLVESATMYNFLKEIETLLSGYCKEWVRERGLYDPEL